MRHISDELPMLLTGDVTRDVVIEAARHLRVCVDCQQELVSAVIAHASLTSAHRFAPEIVAPGHDGEQDDAVDDSVVEPIPLPDMSTLFAEARAEKTPTTVSDLGQRRMRRRLVAVAAAAAVVVGGGATYAVVSNNGGQTSPTTRTVALEGTSDTQDGKVVLIGTDRMRIDASALPSLDSGHQYEVWLTDNDGNDKQPIGYIDTPDRRKEITVPSKVMSQYNNIAVSVQKIKQTEYSGITVLSGTYG